MKIITYPNPILENKSTQVNVPLSLDEADLIKQMWHLVQGVGVGLAAPQVGVNKQIFIVHLGEDKDLKKHVKEPDFVVINPQITFLSQLEAQMVEGCLSFPDEFWQIWRPANVQVKYDTISNFQNFVLKGEAPIYKKSKILNAKGWLSRVLQHEYDHLNGEIFIKKGGKKLKNKDLEALNEAIVD